MIHVRTTIDVYLIVVIKRFYAKHWDGSKTNAYNMISHSDATRTRTIKNCNWIRHKLFIVPTKYYLSYYVLRLIQIPKWNQ